MNTVFWLLLLIPATDPGANNLDFRTGTLAGWQGNGFYVTTGSGRGPSVASGVCSSDVGRPGRTGSLGRSLTVPRWGGSLRCTAYATRRGQASGDPTSGDPRLDIRLETPAGIVVPKQVLLQGAWQPALYILGADKGRPREYQWDLSAYPGQTLRLTLLDEDPRPGCHLYCAGLCLDAATAEADLRFGQAMVRLSEQNHLTPMARFDTRHFLALSNADDEFSIAHLKSCERVYEPFLDHFRKRGFDVHPTDEKLMVAIFDSQAGFEAYIGRPMPGTVGGMYDRLTNRLVVYDFGSNRLFQGQKEAAWQEVGKVQVPFQERQNALNRINRQARDFRNDINVATVVHEVAHQLSFNSGLLSRQGDAPLWLVEGLACYCESTVHGTWTGIGEPNLERIQTLARAQSTGDGTLFPVKDLIVSDTWIRSNKGLGQPGILGYAQSWALFRMLMEERPRALKAYLEQVKGRPTADHRLTDFGQAFGPDLKALEAQYLRYINTVVAMNPRPRR